MCREDFRGPEWITQKLFGGMRSIGLPMQHLMTDGAESVLVPLLIVIELD